MRSKAVWLSVFVLGLVGCASPQVEIKPLAAGRYEAVSLHYNSEDAHREGVIAAATHCKELNKPFDFIRANGKVKREKRRTKIGELRRRPKIDPTYQMPTPRRDIEVTVKFACRKPRKQRVRKGRKPLSPEGERGSQKSRI